MTTPKVRVGAAHKPSAAKEMPGVVRGKTPAAVVVAHGMGQQVPFETLDQLLFGGGNAAAAR